MQVNVAGLRRNIKNLAHNYSDAQVKVREATSNDPWGPSAAIMAEIADLTYNVVAFSEIMQMIWKRLNDHGKNWRHVYKALILLEYLIKTGTEKVAQQCKENIFAIQTLREFVYYEEGKDQGNHVREKAKQLVNLLKDDERLKNERVKALKAKERFAQHPSGFGSDGYIDGPSHRDMPPGWQEEQKPISELELVRPQTAGEEELQLKLAMAMSREEAEQEEAKRRSDDVRLQLALSQSEQDFKEQQTPRQSAKEENQSHLLDLLDISLGAASISSPPLGAAGGIGGPDPWVTPVRAASQLSDPWSGTSSPQIDPWQPSAAAMRSNTSSVPLGGAAGGGAAAISSGASNGDAWALRTQSPSVASGSSTEGWLQSNGAALNGNSNAAAASTSAAVADPWLNMTTASSLAAAQPLPTNLSSNTNASPWLSEASKPSPVAGAAAAAAGMEKSLSLDDPWAPKTNASNNDDPWKSLQGAGAGGPRIKPSPDLDEFDIITNRNKTGDLLSNDLLSGPNNNTLETTTTTNSKKPLKTPQAFLGENSSLVNLDNLIKPVVPSTQPGSAAYNPFSDTVIPPKTNLFQQQQPAVPSINQLKQQQPFPMSINRDPWAPINNQNAASQQVKENPFLFETDGLISSRANEIFKFYDEPNSNKSNFNQHFATNYYNNNNNNKANNYHNNNRSSDSDDDVFNTSYVPYRFLNNQGQQQQQQQHQQQQNFNYHHQNSNNNNNCLDMNRYEHQQQQQEQQQNSTANQLLKTLSAHQNEDLNNNNNNNSNNNYSFGNMLGMKNVAAGISTHNVTSGCAFPSPQSNYLGGSLFNYGFYDSKAVDQENYAINSSNLNSSLSIGNNNINNNNNMGWMKPDAASSSNPFLS